jgi:Flp pilus assembly protein TadG
MNNTQTHGLSDTPPAATRRAGRRRGSAVLEASLALPVLLYFSFGMVEFGQYFYAKHTVQAAARDGCRQAILGTATTSTATTAVANTMSAAGFASSGYTLTFTNPTGGATYSDLSTVSPGAGIKATVSVNYGAVGVRPLGVIPANKQVIGITTMIKE